jgi:hypothetical protein
MQPSTGITCRESMLAVFDEDGAILNAGGVGTDPGDWGYALEAETTN